MRKNFSPMKKLPIDMCAKKKRALICGVVGKTHMAYEMSMGSGYTPVLTSPRYGQLVGSFIPPPCDIVATSRVPLDYYNTRFGGAYRRDWASPQSQHKSWPHGALAGQMLLLRSLGASKVGFAALGSWVAVACLRGLERLSGACGLGCGL